ncbi:hypothetical protein L6452_38589 [Arctium lappa]|uniref:Uncharacterized protein n=1 Tax=Arctium lappa TaxID=4217 RepID=A0ACB8XQU8_ARCLA|nr:hypothetical protein L6452_38589 [Arctium lappa]
MAPLQVCIWFDLVRSPPPAIDSTADIVKINSYLHCLLQLSCHTGWREQYLCSIVNHTRLKIKKQTKLPENSVKSLKNLRSPKKSFSPVTTVQIELSAWRNYFWYYLKHHHTVHVSLAVVQLSVTQEICYKKFGKEIDSYDVVLRENGAPIQNYTDHVGDKSTFHLLNKGSAKALDKVVELYGTTNNF